MRERKWKIAPYGGCPGKSKIMEQDRLTRLSWMKITPSWRPCVPHILTAALPSNSSDATYNSGLSTSPLCFNMESEGGV